MGKNSIGSREFKPDQKTKALIEEGYQAIWRAREEGEDTKQYETYVLALEKKYVEDAFGIELSKGEVEDLAIMKDLKVVFPGATVLRTSPKKTNWLCFFCRKPVRREGIWFEEGQHKICLECKKQQLEDPELMQIDPTEWEGGEEGMSFMIESEPLHPSGTYEAKIVGCELVDGIYGKRLRLKLATSEGYIFGFFPAKITAKNKTGRLFDTLFGDLEPRQSDELIGGKLNITVVHKEANGSTYPDVTDISKVSVDLD